MAVVERWPGVVERLQLQNMYELIGKRDRISWTLGRDLLSRIEMLRILNFFRFLQVASKSREISLYRRALPPDTMTEKFFIFLLSKSGKSAILKIRGIPQLHGISSPKLDPLFWKRAAKTSRAERD